MADLSSKLAAARETIARATPGPLTKWGRPDPAQAIAASGRLVGTTVGGNDGANADAHILAVNALPALLDVAEACSAEHGGCRHDDECGICYALARLAEAL